MRRQKLAVHETAVLLLTRVVVLVGRGKEASEVRVGPTGLEAGAKLGR
jgi:hypothetical protein